MRFVTISWKAVFAGLLLSGLICLALSVLGLAVLGAPIGRAYGELIQTGVRASGPVLGFMLWEFISVLIALCAGSYLAGRFQGVLSTRQGIAQGLLVSAFFFPPLVWVFISFPGTLASAGLELQFRTVPTAFPAMNNSFAAAFGDLPELRNNPGLVVELGGRVTGRLLNGDMGGARNIILSRTRLGPLEATQRLGRYQASLARKYQDIGEKVALHFWGLFGIVLLGSLFGALGGKAGAAWTELVTEEIRVEDRRREQKAA